MRELVSSALQAATQTFSPARFFFFSVPNITESSQKKLSLYLRKKRSLLKKLHFSVHTEKPLEEPAEKLPEFSRLQDVPEVDPELGTLVELHVDQDTLYGVIKWIGDLGAPAKMAGIELEEELVGATNGWHNGTQIFACPDRKAVFVPLTHLRPDKRFEIEQKLTNGNHHLTNGTSNGLNEFGDMDCPVVPGFHCPIRPDDLSLFYGRNRGIQGHQNSCYLDATLFVMFSFTR